MTSFMELMLFLVIIERSESLFQEMEESEQLLTEESANTGETSGSTSSKETTETTNRPTSSSQVGYNFIHY